MPPLASHSLLPSQKNEVFEFLMENSIDPSGFEWGSRRSWYSERQAPTLHHRSLPFYFMVDFSSHGMAMDYSPAEVSPFVHADYDRADWAFARPHLAAWAASLARELSAPDLWSELSRQGELLGGRMDDDLPNTPFADDELRQVKATLQELRELAGASFALDATQMAALGSRLEYLEGASRYGLPASTSP